ncbi:MAG: hypothetical protein HZB43_04065 [candidate division Zixibacteria bacterium]|nr:hypothetical protein [candidate division Zixibacteria bacterium]
MTTSNASPRFPLWGKVESALRISWAIVLVAATACLVVIDCGKSTKPKDVKYNIYRGVSHRIFIYDADSLVLLDSIVRQQYPEILAASPDGRSLYVVDRADRYSYAALSKIDIESKQVVWRRDSLGGHLQFLSHGKELLCGADVVRPEDGTVIRHLVGASSGMFGPSTGSLVASTKDSVVAILDASTGESSGRYKPRLSNGLALLPQYTRLHPDGRRVLVIGLNGSVHYSWFVIGDVVTGETLYEYRLALPYGEAGISDDGSVAVVTDPPEMLGIEQSLSVIDLDHLTLIRRFTDILARESQVRFLPDNRHAVLSGRADGHSLQPLRILNVVDMTYQTTTLPPMGLRIDGGLDIGPRP